MSDVPTPVAAASGPAAAATATKSAATKSAARKTAARKTAARKTAATKTAATTTAAKKTAAKKTAAKKTAAKKTAAKKVGPATTAAAAKRADGPSVPPSVESDARPESVYIMAALDAASELNADVEAAGRQLGSRLQAIGEREAATVPGPVLDALGAAAQSTDVADFLRAHQAYSDAVRSVVDDAVAKYNEAVADYAHQLEVSWKSSREQGAKLFADYVTAITGQLHDSSSDPATVAQVGWSLVAMAQLAAAGQAGG